MRRCRRFLFAWSALSLCCSPAAAAVPVRIAFGRQATVNGQTVNQIWIADAKGRHQRRLGAGLQSLIAPNGQLVAAWSAETDGVRVYRADRGPGRRFFAGEISQQLLAWSPDSRYLAVYNQSALRTADDGLYVVDLKLGTTTLIAPGLNPGASFAPALPDRLAYSIFTGGSGPRLKGDIFTTSPTGSDTRRLTHDGNSANPLWGPHWIAFDRIHAHPAGPSYYQAQIWLMRPSGQAARSLTHIRLGINDWGPVPTWWSGSGRRLIARPEGGDTLDPDWAVAVPSGHSTSIHGTAGGISRGGGRILVTYGHGRVSAVGTVPFGGGNPRLLIANAGGASWNG